MSSPPVDSNEHRAPPPLPGVSGLVDALHFVRYGVPEVGSWALYLPAIGLGFGIVWVAVDRALAGTAGPAARSLAVVLVAAAMTRARPLLALGRLLAAIPGRGRGRQATSQSARGAVDLACTAAVVAAEVVALSALGRYRIVGLLAAPVLGCCSMVVLAVGSRAARQDGRRVKFAPAVTFREFGLATTATFAVLFWATEFLGLLLILATALCTIAARVGWHRWRGGVDETAVLATSEMIQCLVWLLLAALA
jgi:hypothetical protein